MNDSEGHGGTGNPSPRKSADTDTAIARPSRARGIAGRVALFSFALVIMAGGTVFGTFYRNSAFVRAFVRQLFRKPFAVISNNQVFSPSTFFPSRHATTVLVLGCDSDYEGSRPVAIKTHIGRSDAMMLARFDFDLNKISVLSIPRDCAVIIPNHPGYHKINAASEFGGPDLAVETVRRTFGVTPDYYMTLDFDGFKQVVDRVGGVDLTVHKKLDYDDNWGNLHIHFKPGFQHMTGYQAMGYVRMRHSDNDFERANRQHEFLEALRGKVKDPRNWQVLPGVFQAIETNIKSNMSLDQQLTLADFARKVPKENIELQTLPVTEGRSFVYINPRDDSKIIGRMFVPENPDSVTINAPDRYAMGPRRGRGKHRKSKRGPAIHTAAARDDAPTQDLDEPEPPDAGNGGSSPEDSKAPKGPESDSNGNTRATPKDQPDTGRQTHEKQTDAYSRSRLDIRGAGHTAAGKPQLRTA